VRTFSLIILFGLVFSTQLGTAGSLFSNDNDKKIPQIEAQVKRLEHKLSSSSLVYMLDQLKQLEAEVRFLRGQVEVLGNQLSESRKLQQEMYLDLDERMQDKGQGRTAETRLGGDDDLQRAKLQNGQQTVDAATEVETSPEQNAAYEKAVNKLQNGQYVEAIDAFTAFIENYSKGNNLANAHYWLAEAYYVRREFGLANEYYHQLIDKFPSNSKIHEAHLKTGFIEYEMKNWFQSKAILNRVVDNYPDSSVARLARERLNYIDKLGH